MPLYIEPAQIDSGVNIYDPVLIAVCRICPAISLALAAKSPCIKFFSSLLRTPAFEEYIKSIESDLHAGDLKTGYFESNIPFPMICLWTKGQRARLLKKSKKYKAILVLGCDSAVNTIKETVKNTEIRVIPAMKVSGIVSAVPRFSLPLNISFDQSFGHSIAWPKYTEDTENNE